MANITLTVTNLKTNEIVIFPKTKLKIKVVFGNARLELFKPHSIIADINFPLSISEKDDGVSFIENVSEYSHFVIYRNFVDSHITYELY